MKGVSSSKRGDYPESSGGPIVTGVFIEDKKARVRGMCVDKRRGLGDVGPRAKEWEWLTDAERGK